MLLPSEFLLNPEHEGILFSEFGGGKEWMGRRINYLVAWNSHLMYFSVEWGYVQVGRTHRGQDRFDVDFWGSEKGGQTKNK